MCVKTEVLVTGWPVEQQNNAITNKLLDLLDQTPPTKECKQKPHAWPHCLETVLSSVHHSMAKNIKYITRGIEARAV
jgi:hypothetical protein